MAGTRPENGGLQNRLLDHTVRAQMLQEKTIIMKILSY